MKTVTTERLQKLKATYESDIVKFDENDVKLTNLLTQVRNNKIATLGAIQAVEQLLVELAEDVKTEPAK